MQPLIPDPEDLLDAFAALPPPATFEELTMDQRVKWYQLAQAGKLIRLYKSGKLE